MNETWLEMIRSVETRRDVNARYYKPVCLLAVIDGMDQGLLKPSDIDFEIVFGMFEAYVMPVAPKRAAMAWRPFWHLSRDGAWSFSNDKGVIRPEDFGRERKPNSKRELLAKCDIAAVLPTTRRYWLDRTARSELRRSMIEMMLRDDPVCRQIACALSSGRVPVKAIALGLSPAEAMNSRSGLSKVINSRKRFAAPSSYMQCAERLITSKTEAGTFGTYPPRKAAILCASATTKFGTLKSRAHRVLVNRFC